MEEEKREFQIQDYFKVGYFIDAKDNFNQWKSAIITKVFKEKNRIQVNFDGQSSKNDEIFFFKSYKIDRFRTFTSGSKGVKVYGKGLSIRENMEFSEELYQQHSSEIKKLLENNFKGMNALEVVQLIGGRYFRFIDFCLQQNFIRQEKLIKKMPSSETGDDNNKMTDEDDDDDDDDIIDVPDTNFIKLNFQILKEQIEFTVKYLEYLPTLHNEMLRYRQNTNLFFQDDQIAISQIYEDIIDNLLTIFGTQRKLPQFYIKNFEFLEEYQSLVCQSNKYAKIIPYIKKKEFEEQLNQVDKIKQMACQQRILRQYVPTWFINYFGEQGGFEAIKKLLTHNEKYPLAFEIVAKLINIIDDLTRFEFLQPEIQKELNECILQYIKQRLSTLSEKEIKDLDKDQVEEIFKHCQNIYENQFEDPTDWYKIEEYLDLEVSLKCLQSGILEKKLKGISEIKLMTERVVEYQNDADDDSNNNYNSSYSNHIKKTKYLSLEMMIQWLQQNKVLEFILKECNIEILKRSADIFLFLAGYDSLPINIIDQIWEVLTDKHETIVRALYDLIIDILQRISIEAVEKIYSYLKKIPLKDFNALQLEFLKKFTEKSNQKIFEDIQQYNYQIQKQQNDISIEDGEDENEQQQKVLKYKEFLDDTVENLYTKVYGFQEMWQLSLDNTLLNPQLKQIAQNNLKQILSLRFIEQVKKSIFDQALELLQNGSNVQLASSILYELQQNQFRLFQVVKIQEQRNQFIQGQLQNLPENIDLIESNLLILLNETCLKAYKLEISQIQISNLDIQTLWQSYQQKGSNIKTLIYFIGPEWRQQINLGKKSDRSLYTKIPLFFNDNLKTYIFEKILCNANQMDYKNLTMEKFDLFILYWRWINDSQQKIIFEKENKPKIYTGVFQIQTLSEIIGDSSLQQIIEVCQNKQVVLKACDIFSNLNVCFPKEFESDQAQKIFQRFIDKCMNLLQNAQNNKNYNLIESGIILLNSFISNYEGKYIIDQQELSNFYTNYNYFYSNINQVNVNFIPDNKKLEFKFNIYHPFGLIRKQIAETLKIPQKVLIFHNTNSEITTIYDNTSFKDVQHLFNFQTLQVQKRNGNIDKIFENAHPKHIISNNQQYFDLLLGLLGIQQGLSDDSSQIIWDILMTLPTNQTIKQQIMSAQEPWQQIIQGSFHKIFYCIKIIEEIKSQVSQSQQQYEYFKQYLSNNSNMDEENADNLQKLQQLSKQNEEIIKWPIKFTQTGGFNCLIQIFQEFQGVRDPLSKKFLEKLLKLIISFGMYYNEKQYQFQVSLNQQFQQIKIIEKVLICIDSLCKYVVLREEKDLENSKQVKQQINESNLQVSNDQQKQPPFFIIEKQIITQLFNLLDKLMELFFNQETNQQQALYNHIKNFQYFESLLVNGLILSDNFIFRYYVQNGIQKFVGYSNKIFLPLIVKFLMGKVLQTALKLQNGRTSQFYQLLKLIIQENSIEDLQKSQIQFDCFALAMVEQMNKKESKELNNEQYDDILDGTLQVLCEIVKKFENIKLNLGQKHELVDQILKNYLFKIPSKDQPFGAKCKNAQTRNSAFDLLLQLSLGCQQNTMKTIQYTNKFHLQNDHRQLRTSDYAIQCKNNEKSSCGYVGLKNLGCICYMNSLIQQLFMIPTFRQQLLNCQDDKFDINEKQDNILFQLKCIFMALKESQKQHYNPKGFCHSFKDYDGQPTNVFEQMDVDEFFNMLMDRLENQIKESKGNKNFIAGHFGGVYANEIICKGCPHYSERQEPFMAVSLQVENKKDIQESLQNMIDGEILDNDNAYHCEACDKKVSALKRISIKKLPNHLIFVLKRFKFDYDNGMKVKLNDRYEFPTEINMEDYTQQGLNKKEKENKKDEKQQDEYPDSYFKYKLRGIVIHMGVADSGHYYSFINDREFEKADMPQWYEFNDTSVRMFNPEEIPNESYGGEESWRYGYQDSMKEKVRNAYLLFYDRVDPYFEKEESDQIQKQEESKPQEQKSKQEGIEIENENDLSSLQSNDTIESTMENFKQELIKENENFYIQKFIFNQDYISFVINLVENYNFTQNFDQNLEYPYTYNQQEQVKHSDLEILKYIVKFTLTCAIREKEKQKIHILFSCLYKNFENNYPICFWFITLMCNSYIIQELLHFNNNSIVKKQISDLAVLAFKIVFAIEKKKSNNDPNLLKKLNENMENNRDPIPISLAANFINVMLETIVLYRETARFSTESFMILKLIASVDNSIILYLLEKRFIGRFLLSLFCQKLNNLDDEQTSIHDVLSHNEDIPYEDYDLIGIPVFDNKKKSNIEEKQLNQQKQNTIQKQAYRSYLWSLFYELIVYCQITKDEQKDFKRPGQKGKFILTDEEYQLLDLNQERISLILNNTELFRDNLNSLRNKLFSKSVSQALAYLSFNNQQLIGDIINQATKNIIADQAKDYKLPYMVLKYQVLVKDDYQEYRSSQLAQMWAQQNVQIIDYVLGLIESQYLNDYQQQQTLPEVYQQLILNGIVWPTNDIQLKNIYKLCYCRLTNYLNGKWEVNQNQIDQDDCLVDYYPQQTKFEILKIDKYHSGKFINGQIVSQSFLYKNIVHVRVSMEEMNFNNGNDYYIEICHIDDEKLHINGVLQEEQKLEWVYEDYFKLNYDRRKQLIQENLGQEEIEADEDDQDINSEDKSQDQEVNIDDENTQHDSNVSHQSNNN